MFEFCDFSVNDSLHILMDATLNFYERSPLVASTGFLSVLCSIPLWFILNFAVKIKNIDNEAVRIRLEHEFSMASLKFHGDK